MCEMLQRHRGENSQDWWAEKGLTIGDIWTESWTIHWSKVDQTGGISMERIENAWAWHCLKGLWLILYNSHFYNSRNTLLLQQLCEAGSTVIPILQMKGFERKEIKWSAYTAAPEKLSSQSRRRGWIFTPDRYSEQKRQISWHLNQTALKHCISSCDPKQTQTWSYIFTTSAPTPMVNKTQYLVSKGN